MIYVSYVRGRYAAWDLLRVLDGYFHSYSFLILRVYFMI